ncbi:MAG: papain-like cysteine protease family protein [Planctomycetota bacterium]
MNMKLLIGVGAAVLVLIVVHFMIGRDQVDDRLTFEDVEVRNDENALGESAKGYITIPAMSADADAVVDLIGAIAVREVVDGEESWTFDVRFRPSREQIGTKLVDELLFQGVVSAKASFGGRFQVLSGSVSAEDLAEVSIKNILTVGYKDSQQIPFKRLEQIDTQAGKDYYFIDRVIVSNIHARRFAKRTGESQIDGVAFGANGDVYVSKEAISNRKRVSFRPIDITMLQPSEAGPASVNPRLFELAAKARRGDLSQMEADQVIDLINEETRDNAPAAVTFELPPPRKPPELIDTDPVIWLQDVRPIRQTSPQRCWAAAATILKNWQNQNPIDEARTIRAIGQAWEQHYDEDRALPRGLKLDFLTDAGFDYQPPQGYSPQGLASLLREHGPIWFTIGEELGRHATVLTGLFIDPDNQAFWVSYIDPADGKLKAQTYALFMRRYEAPAYLANEEGIRVALTERDLDIQVIHLRDAGPGPITDQ